MPKCRFPPGAARKRHGRCARSGSCRRHCVRGRFFRGHYFCTSSFCCSGCGYLLRHRPIQCSSSCGCGNRGLDRSGDRLLRMETAPGKPEAADWGRHWEHPRHLRRLSVRAGDSQQCPGREYAELSSNPGHAADGLCRPDRGREQRRPAEPGSAGRNFRRREAVEEELQDSRHQRHHRRAHRRHCRNGLPRRHHCDSAVRVTPC